MKKKHIECLQLQIGDCKYRFWDKQAIAYVLTETPND